MDDIICLGFSVGYKKRRKKKGRKEKEGSEGTTELVEGNGNLAN